MKRHHHRVNISKRELGSFSWRPYSLLSSVFASHGREGGEIYSHCVCASPVSSPPSLYTITYNKRTPRDTTTFTSSIQHFALLLLLLWACGELLVSFHSLLFVFLFCCFFLEIIIPNWICQRFNSCSDHEEKRTNAPTSQVSVLSFALISKEVMTTSLSALKNEKNLVHFLVDDLLCLHVGWFPSSCLSSSRFIHSKLCGCSLYFNFDSVFFKCHRNLDGLTSSLNWCSRRML
jgi:hypothetical protein